MSSSESPGEVQTINDAIFLHEDSSRCLPIPQDDPTVLQNHYFGQTDEISIPFSSSQIKGAYVYPKPPRIFDGHSWFFLPIELSNVVMCEITGEIGEEERRFCLMQLSFVREETTDEKASRKLLSEAKVVQAEFLYKGGVCCPPILRDNPIVINPSFLRVKGENDGVSIGGKHYDVSLRAQEMLQGFSCFSYCTTPWSDLEEHVDGLYLSHLSIPFPSPSAMKGAYICLDEHTTCSLSLTILFTLSDGVQIAIRYDIPKSKQDDETEWHFLPIDLTNVVMCEIQGKKQCDKALTREFPIFSLIFCRKETPEESIARKSQVSTLEQFWDEAQSIKPKFMKEGEKYSIPRAESVLKLSISAVSAKDQVLMDYDKSVDAKKMLKGKLKKGVFISYLSIPFKSPCSVKGAYICVHKDTSSPSLLFTFTDSHGRKTSKKYDFSEPQHEHEWLFLPVYLYNVGLCEIQGKGQWFKKNSLKFCINSLVFIGGEKLFISSSDSFSLLMSSLTTDIQTVEPEFVHEGHSSCSPIPRDSPNVMSPEFSTIKAIDGTKEEGDSDHDQRYKALEMMKEELNVGHFTHISIPFPSSSPMKGAYISLDRFSYQKDNHPPSHLIFTLTSSKGDKTFKKYEFPKFFDYHWYFLPVDLPDVVLCEITGKGRKKRYFGIRSLIFIREETHEETIAREAKEKLWSEAPVVKPKFVKAGDRKSNGRDSIPIPRDDPKLVYPSFSMVKCKDDSYSKESKWYDRSSQAQIMLKGECDVWLSNLFIPFPSPSPMKGAYICVNKDLSSPSLLFTFTDCDGKKTFKKYEFTKPKHKYEWHFLPIDLDNVVLCEIEGKGDWCDKNCRYFWMHSLVFLRGDDIPTSPPLLTPVPVTSSSSKTPTSTSSLPSKVVKEEEEEDTCHMSSSTDAVIQTVEPEFIHKGHSSCSPIPRDSPNIKSPEFSTIKAIAGTKEEGDEKYNQSSEAQEMMKGEYNIGHFTNISISFSSSSPMKGAFISLSSYPSPPSHLIFTLTSSKGEKTSKKYEFPEFEDEHWYFLPVDLPDVVMCEITGKGREEEYFRIESLVFISREETPEEIKSREAREKLWSEAPVVKPEFVKKGDRKSIPIPRDDPKLVDPSFSMVKCKDDSVSMESGNYDRSSDAQRMLKGECGVSLSHFSIPFPAPSPVKGACICVDLTYGSPTLLFTFTDCDGKKTYKKYEFTRLRRDYGWYFLPIDLNNVVLCEIEGKGTWWEKNSRHFSILSLVFIRGDDILSSPLLTPVPVPSSSSKTPTSTSSLPSKVMKEGIEDVIQGNDKDSASKDTKQKKPKEGMPKYKLKHPSLTLTSAATLTPQCIIGSGGFGEVLLVKVDGIPFPCVLKKMLKIADEKVVKDCRKEFKVQLKLFNNPKCFNRIPRPLYILDLLDCDMKGVYGFLMEFCVGGSVRAFAKRWCADGKYVSVDDTADDSEPSDSDSDSCR
ncbi:hypothetical protein ADUPG1_008997 [Aduncisulcus paluster]|uniref:Uncharacterized protein n=1 Tax=Aduncisulcus paluster TaxID=2918883 RepID=A0ABQ5KWW4_9EUKA|nr:hypothetical protein ADUPG1_008997 [Aduncisulcus paluster]